jgi:hypothetical protein
LVINVNKGVRPDVVASFADLMELTHAIFVASSVADTLPRLISGNAPSVDPDQSAGDLLMRKCAKAGVIR